MGGDYGGKGEGRGRWAFYGVVVRVGFALFLRTQTGRITAGMWPCQTWDVVVFTVILRLCLSHHRDKLPEKRIISLDLGFRYFSMLIWPSAPPSCPSAVLQARLLCP